MLIAHLSDPHLRPRGALYQGLVDSNTMFAAALTHLAGLSPAPDVVVVSGDVVDEGSPAEYALARELLADVAAPLVMIPGNHDDREGFRSAFADLLTLTADGPLHVVAGGIGPVRIVGLDVTVPGHHHGDAAPEAVAWLDDVLASDPDRPTVVVVHQPPFATGVGYLDAYWCRHGERIARVLERYPAVERLLCGHVHRTMTRRFAGTIACTAPSTTTTIALRLGDGAQPASYLDPPALLLHHWTPGAGILTHHVPIGVFPGPLPFA